MKKKWLIGLTSVLMSVTLCLGFASCKEKEEEKGLTDQEIANSAIEYVKTQYDVSTKLETPEDYEVVSEAPASDGKNYAVTYTVAAKDAGVTIGDYVAVGENKDGKTKISVTRGTVDVNYTLNASVKVNEATASAAIAKKVPATTTPSGGPQGGGEGGDDTQESLLYTLVATKKGENSDETQISNYTVSSPCTVDGITWDVVGNTSIGTGDYDISNWRLGGKSSNCDGVDRTITGRGAVSGTVKSVVITFAAASTSGITVNSVTLKVYNTDPGTGSPEPVATKSVTWSANGTCTVTADGEGWQDCYYQLVANLTVTASSGNKFISLDNIKFYGEGGNQGGAQGGGEGGQPAAHVCAHVCTICGKCYDDTCEDPVCTEKCECNFGTKESPLSVSQVLTLVNNKLTDGEFTSKPVYVVGIANNTPSGSTYWTNLTLKDESTSDTILVYSVNLRDSEKTQAPAQNDKLLICGYVKNYNGDTMEFATNSGTYVYIEENTRGESNITVSNDGGATVSGLPTTNKATNGTTVSFTVTANEKKQIVSVKANDKELNAEEENTYKFVIAGDTTVAITTADEGAVIDTTVASLTFGTEERANDGHTNQYNATWEATRNNIKWEIVNFSNNNGSWDCIKTGHKSAEGTDWNMVGTIATKTAIAKTVTKVVVDITANSENIPTNIKGFKLQVCSDDKCETVVSEVSLTMAGGKNTFVVPTDKQAENLYYKLVFDCAVGTGNGFVQVNSVTYIGH